MYGNMEILVNRDSPIVLNELENFSPLAVSPSVKFVRYKKDKTKRRK